MKEREKSWQTIEMQLIGQDFLQTTFLSSASIAIDFISNELFINKVVYRNEMKVEKQKFTFNLKFSPSKLHSSGFELKKRKMSTKWKCTFDMNV